MRLCTPVIGLVMLLGAGRAFAQVELVDPDAPSVRPGQPKAPPNGKRPSAVKAVDPDPAPAGDDDTTEPDVPGVDSVKRPKKRPNVRPASAADVQDTTTTTDDDAEPDGRPSPERVEKKAPIEPIRVVKPPPPQTTPAPPLVVPVITDADLEQTWLRWKRVESGSDVNAEQAARAELVAMKQSIGASDIDAWAMGLLRLSASHEAKGDSGAAVEIAKSAVELAPDLPSAWTGLARAYLQADPSEVGRIASALATAVSKLPSDPRFSRPFVADFAATVMLALVGTAIAVIAVLFLRRAYYFFYDFHFFFPRAASRWQTTALALLLLCLPIVFRLGIVPALLCFFAASTLYVTQRERVVAAALLGALGLVPTLTELVVEHTAFAGTAADELTQLERGGPGLEPIAQRWEKLAQEDKVGFPERFVLGRHHLRRGHLDQALAHFRKALALNPQHLGARVNLGVAFFLQGDLENSRSILDQVAKENGSAVALYDLSRLYQRRVAVYGESAAGEIDKALAAASEANQKDPSLPRGLDDKPAKEINGVALMRTIPLEEAALAPFTSVGDAGERVRSQLTLMLLGEVPETVGLVYPGLLAALLVALGALGPRLGASKECQRCGKAVSHRGDPDVSPGSLMCTACVNVFAKKNVVAPSLKVRKQLEVARYQSRVERTGLVLGALWSGMGHVFAGLPVSGAAYGFCFVAALVGAVMRHGLLRTEYDGVPAVLKLVPLGLLLALVYVISLRGLRRRQG